VVRTSVRAWQHEPLQKSALATAPDLGTALRYRAPATWTRGLEQPVQARKTWVRPERQVQRVHRSDASAFRHYGASPGQEQRSPPQQARLAAQASKAQRERSAPWQRVPTQPALQTRRPAPVAPSLALGAGSRIDAAGRQEPGLSQPLPMLGLPQPCQASAPPLVRAQTREQLPTPRMLEPHQPWALSKAPVQEHVWET
jgi:hypothetical protein